MCDFVFSLLSAPGNVIRRDAAERMLGGLVAGLISRLAWSTEKPRCPSVERACLLPQGCCGAVSAARRRRRRHRRHL